MIIKQLKIKSLKNAEYNPRKLSDKQKEDLKQSITEFGEMEPAIINTYKGRENVIISGHQRLNVAKELGKKEWPCIEVKLPIKKEKELNVRMNKNTGEWDWDVLSTEFDVEDLQDWGFDDISLITDDEPKEGLTDEDTVPESPIDPITKPGDLYKLGNHRLLCGDSTNIQHVERLMDGEKADMVFTDPPYGVDYKGINNDSRDGLEDLLRGAFASIYAVSNKGSSFYCFHSDKCADIFHKVYREFFHFSSMIIWNKPALVLSQTDYQSKHEPCLYGWMDNGTHSFYGDRQHTSVWDIGKEKVDGHTTPKPVELIEKAVNNSSKVKMIIIDFFGGSGSTLIACEKTNRKCRMMELDPKYCDVIVKRWEEYTGNKAELING